MANQAMYQQKRVSADDAVRQVRNGDAIIVPTGAGGAGLGHAARPHGHFCLDVSKESARQFQFAKARPADKNMSRIVKLDWGKRLVDPAGLKLIRD